MKSTMRKIVIWNILWIYKNSVCFISSSTSSLETLLRRRLFLYLHIRLGKFNNPRGLNTHKIIYFYLNFNRIFEKCSTHHHFPPPTFFFCYFSCSTARAWWASVDVKQSTEICRQNLSSHQLENFITFGNFYVLNLWKWMEEKIFMNGWRPHTSSRWQIALIVSRVCHTKDIHERINCFAS